MNRKHEINCFIKQNTQSKLYTKQYDTVPLTASQVSEELHMDRSNVSRLMNNLYREGELIKTKSKPTYFLSRSYFAEQYKGIYIPAEMNSLHDMIQWIKEPKDEKRIQYSPLFHDLIGCHQNESLYPLYTTLYSSILYPNGGINLILYGEKYTCKEETAKNIAKEYLQIAKKENKEICTLNCFQFSIESFEEQIYSLLNKKKIAVLILINIESLALSHMDRLQFILNQYNVISRKKGNPIFMISTSNTLFENTLLQQMHSIFPNEGLVPNINNRTIKEKFAYILRYFQKECNEINNKIFVNKEIINCFLTSEYNLNFKSLRNEIKIAISKAYTHSDSFDQITITFNDLSNYLLDNIKNVSPMLTEINSIYHYLNTENFVFIPNIKNEMFEKIILAHRTENGLLQAEEIPGIIFKDLYSSAFKMVKDISDLTIPSIFPQSIKTIYDLIKEKIDFLGPKSDILIYGLSLHLNTVIQAHIENKLPPLYRKGNQLELPKKMIDCAANIVSALTSFYNFSLPVDETFFVAAYLSIAYNKLYNKKPKVLIVCHGENIAQDYCEYINNLDYEIHMDYLNYNQDLQNQDFEITKQRLLQKIIKMNPQNGILLLTDMFPLTNLDSFLSEKLEINVLNLSPISLPFLIMIAENLKNGYTDLSYYKNIYRLKTTSDSIENVTYSDLNTLFDNIETKILNESLVFLNPKKAINAFYQVLQNLSKILKIQIPNIIIAKFIIHSCFSLERVIQKEPLIVKYTKKFKKENSDFFQMVQSEFKLINNTFRVIFPDDELVLISEIIINVQK